TDFAISRPIVLTSPMDGTPQVVRFDATTLWHLDAAEWPPSTASKAAVRATLASSLLCPPKRKIRSFVRHFREMQISTIASATKSTDTQFEIENAILPAAASNTHPSNTFRNATGA